MDQQYLDRSGDQQYAIGQRIVVSQAEINELAGLVARLAAGLRTSFIDSRDQ